MFYNPKMKACMRFLFIAFALAVPAFADWSCTIFDGKGGGTDKPQAEPLEYFTRYPSLHDRSGDFCYLCSDQQRLEAAKSQRVRTDVLFLGRINGRAVYDILYFFDDSANPSWKSLIVQKDPRTYGEILQVHEINGVVSHSRLVKIGNQLLVKAVDNCDRSGCNEEYYRIDRTGPVRVYLPEN